MDPKPILKNSYKTQETKTVYLKNREQRQEKEKEQMGLVEELEDEEMKELEVETSARWWNLGDEAQRENGCV